LIFNQQAVEIWPTCGAGKHQRLEPASELDGGPLFPGLKIDLQEIWVV